MRIRGVLSRRSVRFAACCGLVAGAVALIGATTPRKAEEKAPPRDERLTFKVVELAGPTVVLKSVAEDGLKLIEGLGERISSSEIPQWDPDRHSFLNVPPGATEKLPMIVLDPDPDMTYPMPRLVPDADKVYTMPQFGAPHQGPVPPPDPGRDATPAPAPRFRIEVRQPSESPPPEKGDDQQPERAPSEDPDSGNE